MENISKCVVDQKTGKVLGFVLDVAVDFESLEKVGYYVVDEESQSVFFVGLENLNAFKFDVVLVDGVENFVFCGSGHSGLVGKKIVSVDGQDFGIVKGMQFYRNKLSKITTQKAEILARFVSFVGQDVVFVKFGKKKKERGVQEMKLQPEREAIPLPKVEILNHSKRSVEKPEKINLSMNYYIGKVVQEDVIGLNSERVATKGEVVNKNIFERAKKHNRINQLFFAVSREKEQK